MKKERHETKIWEQYGFATEEEFRKKYPLAGKKKNTGSKVSRQRRRLMSKQEQKELDRVNSRGMN